MSPVSVFWLSLKEKHSLWRCRQIDSFIGDDRRDGPEPLREYSLIRLLDSLTKVTHKGADVRDAFVPIVTALLFRVEATGDSYYS